MCGIAGIHNLDGRPVSEDVLRRMSRLLRHRGPDDSGIHAEGPLGLAHTRLSIIDLAGGRQPMSADDGDLWITFNGEIFNYLEIRADLEKKGHRFATRSDTEVILRAYAEKGEDCVRDFNGQWAFALWDRRRRRLFLSRDRMGVRPLFYARAGNAFVFGSEIKALLVHPEVPREINPRALDQIFTFWHTIPPTTFFQGVSELAPGHSLRVEDGRITVAPYWRLTYPESPSAVNGNTGELAEELKSLLVDAVRLRLRADVPVGAYLSGGLDSTVTTALVRRFTEAPLKTFSVAFEDAEFDESPFQREASRFLGTSHQEVRCTEADIAGAFPDVLWHVEQPILRTAPAPLFLLSRLVREGGFKVVMTGEGADEVFGGYDIFKEAKIRRFWGRAPESLWRPHLLKRLYPYMTGLQNQPEAYRRAFFHVRPQDLADPFFSHLPRWGMTDSLKRLFTPGFKERLAAVDAREDMRAVLPESFRRWDGFAQGQYLEAGHLLPGYILSSQGDRMAMAHSVEGRFPFLDHRVVEFGAKLPSQLKMKVLNEKFILKKCMEGLIPESVRKRPKQPYRSPDGRCFTGSGAPGYVMEALSAASLKKEGIFRPEAVQKLLDKFREGRAVGVKDNMALVGVLSTQIVAYQFIRGFDRRAASSGDA
jgi:asparagine synthase (glutamine-hydrolysing)